MENDSPNSGGSANLKKIDSILYRIKPGYALREIAGEFIAIPVSLQDGPESRIAVLNPEGKFLWEQLQQERSITQLVQIMTDCYDVSTEEAGRDICEFIEQLKINQLLFINENGGET